MQNRLRVLELVDALTEEYQWIRSDDGCPDIETLYNPTIATLCVSEQTVDGDYTSQVLTINYLSNGIGNIFFANYLSQVWNWYTHPEPRLIPNSLLPFVSSGLPGDVREMIVEELRDMVNDLRDDYNLPLAPEQQPPRWDQGEPLEGGILIQWGFLYFYTRFPMTGEENMLSPVNDTRHTRFLPFNQGVMQTPPAQITMQRRLETDFDEMTANEIYIDWNKKYLYIVPDIAVMRLDVDRFSLFSVESEAGDIRLIANLNHRDAWVSETNPNLVGWRLRFDTQWQSGVWVNGTEMMLGFSSSI